jgi:peptide/nickel transport system ATP-binding protein
MSMVLQDPKFSLNPVIRIGDQIAEALEFHTTLSAAPAAARCWRRWRPCASTTPSASTGCIPHEVSGGMGQRVMIAMMVVLEPA